MMTCSDEHEGEYTFLSYCFLLYHSPSYNLLMNQIAREVLDVAARIIRPGITTDEIDKVVHEATIAAGKLFLSFSCRQVLA